jgi:hypothetical protein
MNKFGLLFKSKHKLLDIWSYFLGEYRFYFQKLTRKFIREQISFRIKSIKMECVMNGSCLECGCDIPQLAYCNRPCEGNCYPPMMNKKDWKFWKEHGVYTHIHNEEIVVWTYNPTMSTNKKGDILSQGFVIERTCLHA